MAEVRFHEAGPIWVCYTADLTRLTLPDRGDFIEHGSRTFRVVRRVWTYRDGLNLDPRIVDVYLEAL